jgi:lipopolysaccharide transport system ATP-binding protein
LTGRENVFLNGAILGMSKEEIKSKFDSIVEFSEIGKFIDTPVKHYSSGMYVRLAFSVAAHLEPEILMIDEVLSVGDIQFQQKCMDYAKRLRETNKTVLFVSHNMFAVKTLCSRVIYLSEGKVKFDGPTAEGISLYENEARLDAMGWAKEAIGTEKSKWPIEITDIELYGENDVPRTIFRYGEKMKVRLRFRAKEEIKDANVIIAMIRSDTVACCNYCSALDGSPTTFLLGEGGVELVTPPLKLIAEQYQIVIMVRDKDFNNLYCAQNGKSFHVQHGLFSKHFGVFHERADWRWLNGQNLIEQDGKTERGEQS